MTARPFWMPASSFYVLTIATGLGVFFAIWWLLKDDGEETAVIIAGLSGTVILGGGVFLREFVFRKARNRVIESQRRLDWSLKGVSLSGGTRSDRRDKLTIELNAAILSEIRQKSNAARVLSSMASGHKEVFELCDRYISINGRELKTVSPGSPRIAALLKGKEAAEELHRFHMLKWAEIEAKALTLEARQAKKSSTRIEAAERALSVVSLVQDVYPYEDELKASADAIREFLSSLRLRTRIDKAERAITRDNYKQARKYYEEALKFIDGESIPQQDREFAVEQIKEALIRIEHLESNLN
jgi:hypothetical protein